MSTDREALKRLERAVDMHLGRSSWTQTSGLKGMGYSEAVRKELYAAHDEARAALAAEPQELTDEQILACLDDMEPTRTHHGAAVFEYRLFALIYFARRVLAARASAGKETGRG